MGLDLKRRTDYKEQNGSGSREGRIKKKSRMGDVKREGMIEKIRMGQV